MRTTFIFLCSLAAAGASAQRQDAADGISTHLACAGAQGTATASHASLAAMKAPGPALVAWEFGDGSTSHIHGPQPWSPSMMPATIDHTPSLLRETDGGSPAVSENVAMLPEEMRDDDRPLLIYTGPIASLVNTDGQCRYIAIQLVDICGLNVGPEFRTHYGSGSWPMLMVNDPGDGLFMLLRDLSTGDRWRAQLPL